MRYPDAAVADREGRSIWDEQDEVVLDHYLVSGVENPRINCTSILERALLAERLYGAATRDLAGDEFRFGAILCWLRRRLDAAWDGTALAEAMARRDAGVPEAIVAAYHAAGSGRWLDRFLRHRGPGGDALLMLYQDAWRERLASMPVTAALEVLEFACGSANDYRFWDAYGFGRHIHYHGGDTSWKNIANARRRFPDVDFRRLDILDSGWSSSSVDIVVANDILEHLPPAAIGRAIEEMVRIARSEVWIGCFRLLPGRRIIGRAAGGYHRNGIGRDWLLACREDCQVEVVDIPRLIASALPGVAYHNPRAGLVVIAKP